MGSRSRGGGTRGRTAERALAGCTGERRGREKILDRPGGGGEEVSANRREARRRALTGVQEAELGAAIRRATQVHGGSRGGVRGRVGPCPPGVPERRGEDAAVVP